MIESIGIHSLGVFIVSSLLLNLTPGVDTVYVVTRAVAGGRTAGIVSAVGISSGSLVHCTLVAFGLSSVLLMAPAAVRGVQVLGVLWLGYIAWLTWRGASLSPVESSRTRIFQPWVLYRQAVVTNLLNPKVGFFFLALLPQFVLTSSADNPVPYLTLGAMFIVSGTLVSVAQALLASRFSTVLRNPRVWATTQRVSACALALLAVWLLVQAFRH